MSRALNERPEVTDQTLALEAIHDVATDEGLREFKFAGHPHTAAHVGQLQASPGSFRRETFAAWQADGGHSAPERAAAVAREILADHRPEPLPDEIQKAIRQIGEDTR